MKKSTLRWLSRLAILTFLPLFLSASTPTDSDAPSFTLLVPSGELGQEPVSLVKGDFNNDGVEDLVSLNRVTDDISVLIGLGNGGFHRQIRFSVSNLSGDHPHEIVAGDFDRDGNLDLVVWNGSSTLVLIGRGNGRFRTGANGPWGNSITSVVVGDFNSDNDLDLAIADQGIYSTAPLPPYYAPALIVSFGNGDGSFSLPTRTVMVDRPLALAAGDFNEDGRADLALAYGVVPPCPPFTICTPSTGGLVLLAGRGDGSFDAGDRLGSKVPCAVASGDLNSDGHDDLMVVSRGYAQGGFSPFLSSGNGYFVPGDPIDKEIHYCSITMNDFNADGHLDFATPDSAYLGLGDGTFESPRTLPIGFKPSAVLAQDFNLDGSADLAVTNSGSNDLSVLLASQNGNFYAYRSLATGNSPSGVLVADFNDDSIPDLLVTNRGSNDISVLLSISLNGPSFAVRVPVETGPLAPVVGDFDENGVTDVAVINERSMNVSILLGKGDGTFLSAVSDEISPDSRGMAIADLNGDGHQDLAVTSLYSNDVSILQGNGDGTFQLTQRVLAGPSPLGIVVGDFDEDGKKDLAVANSRSEAVSLLRGRGDGTFEMPKQFSAGFGPSKMAVADFNGDRTLDLAVANSEGRNVSILIGRGNGEFEPQQTYAAEGYPSDIIAADVDVDGKIDVATSDPAPLGGVSLLRGLGDGSFLPAQFLEGGTNPNGIVAGDFGGDHRLGIAVVNERTWNLSIWIRNSRPIAFVDADESVECTSPEGAVVVLNGTGSSDTDSTPGTNDDIAFFEWYEAFGTPYENFLGTGKTLGVNLGMGEHAISLRVTDSLGATDSRNLLIRVLDSTPPKLRVSVNPSRLWPPDHRMVEVAASVEAIDTCSSTTIVLDEIVSNEDQGSSDNGNQKDTSDIQGALPGTADFGFRLRAERVGSGTGRKYTVTYRAVDDSSNISSASAVVTVPLSQSESVRR